MQTPLEQQTAFRNILIFSELEEVLHALTCASIEVIVLKGAAFAHTLYPDLNQRELTDVDLLVKTKDFPAIDNILHTLGYRNLENSTTSYVKDGVVPVLLDLNDHIRHLALPVSHLWNNAVPVVIARVQTLMLCPQDNLIHVIGHMAVSHGTPLRKWLQDVDLIVRDSKPPLNWNIAVRGLRESHLRIPAYFTLLATQKEFATPVAPGILNALAPGKKDWLQAGIFEALLVRGRHIPWVAYVLPVLITPGRKNKTRAILSYLFPCATDIRKRYRLPDWFPALLIYPIRVLGLIAQGCLAMTIGLFQMGRKEN